MKLRSHVRHASPKSASSERIAISFLLLFSATGAFRIIRFICRQHTPLPWQRHESYAVIYDCQWCAIHPTRQSLTRRKDKWLPCQFDTHFIKYGRKFIIALKAERKYRKLSPCIRSCEQTAECKGESRTARGKIAFLLHKIFIRTKAAAKRTK